MKTLFATLLTSLLVLCAARVNGQCEADFEFTVRPDSLKVIFRNSSTGTQPTNYFWKFGDGTTSHLNQSQPSHTYQDPGEYLVRLEIRNQNNSCLDIIEKRVCVRCVFPGDANSDGLVNNVDVLYLGLSYGSIGPVRDDDHNGGPEYPWLHSNGPANYNNGINIQHSDCDGNGSIDREDVALIDSNYNQRSFKSGVAECLDINDIPLFLVVPDSIQAGDTVSIAIHLGTNQIPATDVYGIAFSINYDNDLIRDTSLSIDYSASLFGADTAIIFIDKDVPSANRIETAVTRIDQTEETIIGQIGELNFVMEDNLAQKDYLTAILNLSFSDIILIKKNETTLPVCAFVDSVVVWKLMSTGIATQKENRIVLYPNPANDFLKIDFSTFGNYEVTVMNVLGKQIIRENTNGNNYTLNTSLLSKGVYFLSLGNGDSLQTFKFEVSR